MALQFRVVAHGSEEYRQVTALREAVLRKPFGLKFSPEELAEEKPHIHIAGYLDGRLVATAALVPDGNRVRMKRVAVVEELQGQGIGGALLAYCEDLARRQGLTEIFCHARDSAIAFYDKHGFTREGDYFEEVTILHLKMHKSLG